MLALASACAAVVAGPAAAQDADPLTLSASVRVRGEAIDGHARAGAGISDDVLAIRTILTGEYDAGPVTFGAELYDSRVYGADPGSITSANDVNAFELVQAYVRGDLGELLGTGSRVSARAGRFTFGPGSRRLIASDDYRNTTNGYTGVLVEAQRHRGMAATLFYVLPQQRRPDDAAGVRDNDVAFDHEGFDQQLFGGFVSQARAIGRATIELSYVGFRERDRPGRPTRNRALDNVGARVVALPEVGRIDYEVEAILQTGRIATGTAAEAPRVEVAAWFVHASAGYSFPGPAKARLSVEYDYASGDGPGGSFGRFDTLFGLRRAEFGPAGIYAVVSRSNLHSPGLRLEVAPTRRFDAHFVWRPLWLASATDAFATSGVRDASGRAGDFAGHQFDARMRWWVVPGRLRAEVNAIWLAKGRFLREAPNSPTPRDTRYVAFGLTASL